MEIEDPLDHKEAKDQLVQLELMVALERQVLLGLREQPAHLGYKGPQEILVSKAPRVTVVPLVLQGLSVIWDLKGQLARRVKLELRDRKVIGAPRDLLEPRVLMVLQDLLVLPDPLEMRAPKGRRELKDQMGNLDQRVLPATGGHREHPEAQGRREIKEYRDRLEHLVLKEPREAQALLGKMVPPVIQARPVLLGQLDLRVTKEHQVQKGSKVIRAQRVMPEPWELLEFRALLEPMVHQANPDPLVRQGTGDHPVALDHPEM